MKTKNCRSCRQDKAAEDFPGRKGSADGLHSYCQACVTARSTQWRRENRDRARQLDRARRRDLRPKPAPLRGAGHGNWKGPDVGYSTAHSRLKRYRGSASQYLCVDCGDEAMDWSYRGDDPNERTGPAHDGGQDLRYSTNTDYYDPRCRSCHIDHDEREGLRV